MDIRYQDIVKLDDKNEYVVASKVLYKNGEYIYLVDINDTKNIIFAEIEKDGCISVLDSNYDKNLIQILIPLFFKNSQGDIDFQN